MTHYELVDLISTRDNISWEEANTVILTCANTITQLITQEEYTNSTQLYEEVVQILYDELGLEPDYLDIVLEVD